MSEKEKALKHVLEERGYFLMSKTFGFDHEGAAHGVRDIRMMVQQKGVKAKEVVAAVNALAADDKVASGAALLKTNSDMINDKLAVVESFACNATVDWVGLKELYLTNNSLPAGQVVNGVYQPHPLTEASGDVQDAVQEAIRHQRQQNNDLFVGRKGYQVVEVVEPNPAEIVSACASKVGAAKQR